VASYRHRQLENKQVKSHQYSASGALQEQIDELKNKPQGASVDAHKIARQLDKVQKIVREKEQKNIQYSEMLRILSSLGISIAVFSHETGGAVTRLKASLKNLHSLTFDACKNSTEINEHFGQVDQTTNRLGDLANYINAQIEHTATRKKDNIALYAVIKKFIEQFKNYFNTRKISFEWEVIPNGLRTAPMHRSEIDAVLFNFLTNSVKSMQRSHAEQRSIKVTATRQDNLAIIQFQDTGAGVADNIKNRIFDAFFTTSSQNQRDEIAGLGCGLGLKIVSDIAKVNKGFVRLSEPDSGYGCCFEFGVPISSKQLKLPEV
jgi:signal transduction histidine kinase